MKETTTVEEMRRHITLVNDQLPLPEPQYKGNDMIAIGTCGE